jgi:hypothetical protein
MVRPARKAEAIMGRKWTPEEDLLLGQIWGTGLPKAEYERRFPGRSYGALRCHAGDTGLCVRSAKPPLNPGLWTEEEIGKVKQIWGTGLTFSQYEAAVPGRTYEAIRTKARLLRTAAPGSLAWSRDEDDRLRSAWQSGVPRGDIARMFPNRTRDAIESRARALLKLQGNFGVWTDAELRLLQTAGRCIDRLMHEHHRSRVSLWAKLKQGSMREQHFETLMRQIRAAASEVSPAIRDDVISAIYLTMLSGRPKAPLSVQAVVKEETTKAYGRRHYSLDAPLGDDSGMNWIDTIESDRPHF